MKRQRSTTRYAYAFDLKTAGNLRLTRRNYETLQLGFRLLHEALVEWNTRALEHGAADRPYKKEVKDLERMIKWGDEQLAHAEAQRIDGVGSLLNGCFLELRAHGISQPVIHDEPALALHAGHP